jgi:hypothetical protein
MRAVLILVALAGVLRADSDLVAKAARALSNGNTAVFLNAFDPAMPGFAKLKSRLEATGYSVQVLDMQLLGDSESAGVDTLEMKWQVRLIEREGTPANTDRSAKVTCRVAERQGSPRIVAFEPLDLFTPPDVSGAWDRVAAAAGSLAAARPGAAEPRTEGRMAAFLAAFDPAMPAYEELRNDVTGLLSSGNVDSSLELLTNDGDDRHRTLTVDWRLRLVDPNTEIAVLQRHQTVTCQVERRKRHWLITSFEPLAFLAPPPAGR